MCTWLRQAERNHEDGPSEEAIRSHLECVLHEEETRDRKSKVPMNEPPEAELTESRDQIKGGKIHVVSKARHQS